MSAGMSLWQIDETIAQLLELLDDAGPDEIAPIQQELERYVGQTLPAKVDGYIGIIRQDEVIADAAEAEADRLTKIAKARRARVAWLKSNAKAVMEARGLKRLEGSTGQRLRLQAAGGKQKLTIKREDLVPDEYCDTTVTFITSQWRRIMDRLNLDIQEEIARKCRMVRTPNTEAIRKALETKCARCAGKGTVEGPMPEFATNDETEWTCTECNGTGHQLVPGAELEPRGQTLRVE